MRSRVRLIGSEERVKGGVKGLHVWLLEVRDGNSRGNQRPALVRSGFEGNTGQNLINLIASRWGFPANSPSEILVVLQCTL